VSLPSALQHTLEYLDRRSALDNRHKPPWSETNLTIAVDVIVRSVADFFEAKITLVATVRYDVSNGQNLPEARHSFIAATIGPSTAFYAAHFLPNKIHDAISSAAVSNATLCARVRSPATPHQGEIQMGQDQHNQNNPNQGGQHSQQPGQGGQQQGGQNQKPGQQSQTNPGQGGQHSGQQKPGQQDQNR
jgi:hypothetical protein